MTDMCPLTQRMSKTSGAGSRNLLWTSMAMGTHQSDLTGMLAAHLFDDVSELFDFHCFIIEEGLALCHCRDKWGHDGGGQRQGSGSTVPQPSLVHCPISERPQEHSQIVSFSSLANVLLRSFPMRLETSISEGTTGKGQDRASSHFSSSTTDAALPHSQGHPRQAYCSPDTAAPHY